MWDKTMSAWRKNEKYSLHLLNNQTKKESVLQFSPMRLKQLSDSNCKYSCIGLVLFSNLSPLMQDLYELFEIMLEGHQSDELQNMGEF